MLIDRSANDDTNTHRQKDVAQRIVEALHLNESTSSVETPADSYLPLDKDGEPSQELYNCARVRIF